MDKLKLKIEARSDVGVGRSNNEDSYGIFAKDDLFLVCDGMGGHRAGDLASRLAVKTTAEMFVKLNEKVVRKITKDLIKRELNLAARLIAAIRLANRMIFNKSLADAKLKGMGTTISALTIEDGFAICGHVGDSRIYRFRKDKMELLTEDHTWVNELILDNEIDASQAGKFENKNVITRALGLDRAVKIDLTIEPLQKGDIFLLCTDGLTKALSDDEIKRIVLFNKKKFNHTLNHLIDNANMKDGTDNSTIVILAVEKLPFIKEEKFSTKLTLKVQDNRTSRIENSILKKYYSNSSIAD